MHIEITLTPKKLLVELFISESNDNLLVERCYY